MKKRPYIPLDKEKHKLEMKNNLRVLDFENPKTQPYLVV
jgi:hypothetical protein